MKCRWIVDSVLLRSEDWIMQAIWICIHLHGKSSSANSVVGNTAVMTIRQVASMAFSKVQKPNRSVCSCSKSCVFLSREESVVWLKRTTTSPMSIALGVELLETIVSSHYKLFRNDTECNAVLKQQIAPLVQSYIDRDLSE